MFHASTQAQCAMCRAVLESEDGGQKAKAVNDGIVYLMAFPYILVAAVGYFIYKSRKAKTSLWPFGRYPAKKKPGRAAFPIFYCETQINLKIKLHFVPQ